MFKISLVLQNGPCSQADPLPKKEDGKTHLIEKFVERI